MSKIVILDAGHGGMIAGQYQTAGKRSPNWTKGVLYEGAFNRWICNLIMRELDYAGVPYFHVSPELEDITLRKRVERANKIYRDNRSAYLLSIHANAGGGTGVEGFTSKGDTPSDEIAELFLCNFEEKFKDWKLRSDFYDGDRDKEKDYYVLKNTNCPAFLFECGFMDSKKDYAKLWSTAYQKQLSENLANTIKELYND